MLWFVEREDQWDYDEHDAAVIRADTEQEARKLAGEMLKASNAWRSDRNVKCVPIDPEGPATLIVASFNAG